MKKHILYYSLTVLLSVIMLGCAGPGEPATGTEDSMHPEWSRDATIYEVNVRQYTPEGTFSAFMEHLPRLQELGVEILWFMPIHPIGEKNRKGTLGSYYSVQDYKKVNPEFGTLEDFRELVSRSHEMGFRVIIDWVANHTAWDHPWVTEHPEWYTSDSAGNLVSPFDWSDVVDLNYEERELWYAMAEALIYWVEEADIDGYRCDVAGMVPLEFWEYARTELDSIKPVFMLAEAEQPEHHHEAFDMSYAWEIHHIMNRIAAGEEDEDKLWGVLQKNDSVFPEDSYRMLFLTNHDENSWNGTIEERLGESAEAFAVLTFTLPGMPLIYSGQEAGLDKRLEFFEKDTIDWSKGETTFDFYSKLVDLKTENRALLNGTAGGEAVRIDAGEGILAFSREKEGNEVVVIANLTGEEREVAFSGFDLPAQDQIYMRQGTETTEANGITMAPWAYIVYAKELE